MDEQPKDENVGEGRRLEAVQIVLALNHGNELWAEELIRQAKLVEEFLRDGNAPPSA